MYLRSSVIERLEEWLRSDPPLRSTQPYAKIAEGEKRKEERMKKDRLQSGLQIFRRVDAAFGIVEEIRRLRETLGNVSTIMKNYRKRRKRSFRNAVFFAANV